MKAQEYRESIQEIRSRFLRGLISLDESKVEVQVILDEMNQKGEEIAKKFDKKYRKISFITVFR